MFAYNPIENRCAALRWVKVYLKLNPSRKGTVYSLRWAILTNPIWECSTCHTVLSFTHSIRPCISSYVRFIVKHLVLYGPQTELKGGGRFWLQSLRELHIKDIAGLRLPLDGVLYRLWCKVIDDGIKTAVGHGNAQSDGIDGPDHRFHAAPL